MMDHKILPVCLMTSRGIHQTLAQLAAGAPIRSDRQLAVVAALKLLEPSYEGVATEEMFRDLADKSERELAELSRMIHPVLCSLRLEKWLGASGHAHYLAQSAVSRDIRPRRILLDGRAMEIPLPGEQHLSGQRSVAALVEGPLGARPV